MKSLGEAELQWFIEAAEETEYGPRNILAAYSGLRLSEHYGMEPAITTVS